jgi:hypothetical protein
VIAFESKGSSSQMLSPSSRAPAPVQQQVEPT